MDCLYINLPTQEKRREHIEANFAQHKREGWALVRHDAFDADYTILNGTPGTIRPTEKACYLSQTAAIRATLASPIPVLILEDDAQFGPHSCEIIDKVFTNIPSDEWDVIFCDIGPGSVRYMFELMQLRRQLVRTNECKLLSLKNTYFGCATAYIINPKSRGRVLSLLADDKPLNTPYDLALRNPVFSGELKGWVIFPFATTLSDDALTSQIQTKETSYIDFILSFFRMATWVDRDLNTCAQSLAQRTPPETDSEADIYARIFATLLSSKFGGR